MTYTLRGVFKAVEETTTLTSTLSERKEESETTQKEYSEHLSIETRVGGRGGSMRMEVQSKDHLTT